MPLGAANQRCVAMLYLVIMLAWEVKVEGSQLRCMGEHPGVSILEGYGVNVVLSCIVLGPPKFRRFYVTT